ncbi:response regulator transcription factor [Oceanicella sp. SM1341]|uniref:response regulator n=1 Tax=Oceanicella sp. SM1341 TaxID=1548889 RepID=UPI000E53DA83|nr:response regulator transcription factor [Oceanicella sp. SM1341]
MTVSEVLVIDDHPLFCEALSMTLQSALGVAKVATASRLSEALELLSGGLSPEAILLDLNLPDVAGLDGLIRLKGAVPGIPVIVVSSLSDNRIVTSVVQAGAAGFVPKDSRRDVFVSAFREIWNGGSYTPDGYCPPAEAETDRGAEANAVARLADLTPQQGRILQLVCEGKLNKQIAWELSIAETTVKAHITAILRKLGVQSRTQAVLIAQQARFASILHPPTS